MSVSVSTMPFLKPHFHDNAGSPATGYKLYSYDSTTQDTIPIYKDPAGTVEYPNPLTLNSRGEPDGMGLYLDDNKTYKLVLKTESDVTVWTVNAVHGVSEGSGSVPVINLPGHTVLGNSGDNYAIAEAVEIVSTISPTTDGDLVASVESVRTALNGYLPNSGNNTYNGDLTIGGTVDATTIKIDGVSLEDKFMGKEDHTARTLLGNKEGTAGQLQDIPLVNSLSSGSADEVPSVSAVKAGIQDAVDDITQEISNIGDVNKVSVNGSDAAGYLANKITVGDGLAIEDIGGTLQISMNMDESAQQQCFSISAGHRGTLGYFVSLTELVDLSGQYNGTDYDTNYTIPFTRPSYELNIDTANFIDTTYNRVMFNRTGKWLLIGEMSLAPKLAHKVWSKQEVGLALVINGGGKEVYTAPIDLREKAAQFAYGTYTTYEITAIVDVVAGDTAQFTVNEPNLQCFFKFHGVELSSVSANTIFPDSKRIVYVSNNGSDINDGQTPNKPLATFKAAYNKAKSYQVEEGNTSIWTVVCGDTSVFLEDDLYIPPSISVNMPLAVLNTQTYLAIPESTNFTCDKVIAGRAYTTEQGNSVPTNITINTLDLTGSSDWGLITTGTSSTLVNFKIGKITLTTSDWSGSGVIGAVTGSSSKTLNIDVGSIIFAGTVTSINTSVGMIVWNSSECTVNARVGTVSAHNAKALLCVTNTSFVDLSVGKSDTTAMIYCPLGNGTINLKGGNISGVLGSYAGAPVLNVSGFYSVAGPFVNTNSDQNIVATINLDHFGKISIGGSDIPGYLKEKVVAGDHVTITETDGTLVISSEAGGDSDTYQVKLDASDIADYLPGKILARGAVEINTVALSGNEKQLQIVGTGKVCSDVNDVDYDYLAGKLKAGENVSIAVVDDAGVRKVEITADGSVSSLEDLTDVDVSGATDGQVLTYESSTGTWVPGTGGGGGDTYTVKVNSGDTTPGFLGDKIVAASGSPLTVTVVEDTLVLDAIEEDISDPLLKTTALMAENGVIEYTGSCYSSTYADGAWATGTSQNTTDTYYRVTTDGRGTITKVKVYVSSLNGADLGIGEGYYGAIRIGLFTTAGVLKGQTAWTRGITTTGTLTLDMTAESGQNLTIERNTEYWIGIVARGMVLVSYNKAATAFQTTDNLRYSVTIRSASNNANWSPNFWNSTGDGFVQNKVTIALMGST